MLGCLVCGMESLEISDLRMVYEWCGILCLVWMVLWLMFLFGEIYGIDN